MDFFGMSLTANKIFSMFQSAFSISTMYKWIKEEEIWNETQSLGGMSITVKMEKLGDKRASQNNN